MQCGTFDFLNQREDMRIVINASNLKIGGGLQVAESLIRELPAFREHEFLVFVSDKLSSLLKDFCEQDGIHIIPYNIHAGIFNAIWNRNHQLDRYTAEFKADAVFTIFGPSYWRPKVFHFCGFAIPHYVYNSTDTPFFSHLGKKQIIRLEIMRFLQMFSLQHSADVFVTETHDASQRLANLMRGQQVVTVPNCCNQIFDSPERQKDIEIPDFQGVTLLTVSAWYPHKNLDRLLGAAEYLKEKYPDFKFRFVLTISDEALGIPLYLKENFLLIGKIPIDVLPSLYRQSNMMILPSLLECFSVSYLEAMKSRLPILTSDLAFARDVCGEAAKYFNPESSSSVGEAIYSLASEALEQNILIEKGQYKLKDYPNHHGRLAQYMQYLRQYKQGNVC